MKASLTITKFWDIFTIISLQLRLFAYLQFCAFRPPLRFGAYVLITVPKSPLSSTSKRLNSTQVECTLIGRQSWLMFYMKLHQNLTFLKCLPNRN